MVTQIKKISILLLISRIYRPLFEKEFWSLAECAAEIFFYDYVNDPTGLMDDWLAIQTGVCAIQGAYAKVDEIVDFSLKDIPHDKYKESEFTALRSRLRTNIFALHERLDLYLHAHFRDTHLEDIKPQFWFAGHLMIHASVKMSDASLLRSDDLRNKGK